jgi:hypothetical protein
MSEWPRYESHKIVRAAPIVGIVGHGVLVVRSAQDGQTQRFEPTEPAMAARASIGDYAVIYSDGYKSVSPKKAFEDGYTRVIDAIGTGKMDPKHDHLDGPAGRIGNYVFELLEPKAGIQRIVIRNQATGTEAGVEFRAPLSFDHMNAALAALRRDFESAVSPGDTTEDRHRQTMKLALVACDALEKIKAVIAEAEKDAPT